MNPNAYIEFSFLLNTSLDIFDARTRDRNRVDQDLGMLQAIDERLSIWGWQAVTGTKFAVIVDAWGKNGVRGGGAGEGDIGRVRRVGDKDVKVVSRVFAMKRRQQGRTVPETGSRHSKRYRRHIYSSYKIRSMFPMTICQRQLRVARGKERGLRARSLYKKLKE